MPLKFPKTSQQPFRKPPPPTAPTPCKTYAFEAEAEAEYGEDFFECQPQFLQFLQVSADISSVPSSISGNKCQCLENGADSAENIISIVKGEIILS